MITFDGVGLKTGGKCLQVAYVYSIRGILRPENTSSVKLDFSSNLKAKRKGIIVFPQAMDPSDYRLDDTSINTYKYDITKKEVILDRKLKPSEISISETHWLYARNNKYIETEINPEKVGKWMLFFPSDRIDAVWDQVKEAISEGELWHSKVSTVNPETENSHVLIVYTIDYTDRDDVIRVLDYLENSGIKISETLIKYKTDEQTRAGIYNGVSKVKPWIFRSDTIRNGFVEEFCYEYDLIKKQVIVDTHLNPSETNEKHWLRATNRKYDSESEQGGKWMLFYPRDEIDAVWDRVKAAITEGELWRVDVSTHKPREDYTHALFVKTKYHVDLSDAIRVLDYLEASGIKPSGTVIKYKTEEQSSAASHAGGRGRPKVYRSDTIREIASAGSSNASRSLGSRQQRDNRPFSSGGPSSRTRFNSGSARNNRQRTSQPFSSEGASSKSDYDFNWRT